MHIVFFSHYYAPESNAPASRTYDHCTRWVNKGHRVVVITCAPNVPSGKVYEGYKNRLWPQREVIDGVEVIRVWTFLAANAGGGKRIINYVSYMFSAVFAFLFFCKRPNLIVATSPQFFCGWAGAIASILKWRPFVLEIRDIWPESIVAVGALKRGLLIKILEHLEKLLYRWSNVIVTVGPGYRDNIISKVTGRPIFVVTHGVDAEFFKPREKDMEFLQRFELENKFVCSYVGTIGMAHGLQIVVESAKILKRQNRNDIVFCLVGDGAQREALENEVKQNGLEDFVKFAGRLSKQEMPAVLGSSDCLLIHLKKTDLFESVIPSKIFECMAMSKPLIMGVTGDSSNIVKDAHCGLQIEPENSSQLVDAVTRLCDDSELYMDLCRNGRESVTSKYNRDKLADDMLQILSDAI